jgi:hypothetical protein
MAELTREPIGPDAGWKREHEQGHAHREKNRTQVGRLPSQGKDGERERDRDHPVPERRGGLPEPQEPKLPFSERVELGR